MPRSSVAWLDTSPDEQRRIREALQLFTQTESRDELGIGQIRDALSDTLFPGTSVLHTRARYLLFVPWCYQQAGSRRDDDPRAVHARADTLQRVLTEVLRAESGGEPGVIGARAGAQIKTLPSTIYWGALIRHGILPRAVDPSRVRPRAADGRDEEELIDRQTGDWHPTLPTAPPGFPRTVPGGFALTADEAAWLRERIIERSPDTLLARLLLGDGPPDPGSDYPWEDRRAVGAAAGGLPELEHARTFSVVMHGAALLYNLLVARAYEAAGFTTVSEPVDFYTDELEGWRSELAAERISGWQLSGLWTIVHRRSARLAPTTTRFVEDWVGLVGSREVDRLLDCDGEGARLVADRERRVKGRQARLDDQRLLGAWSGASGRGRLGYRWPTVRTLLTDIHRGVASDARA